MFQYLPEEISAGLSKPEKRIFFCQNIAGLKPILRDSNEEGNAAMVEIQTKEAKQKYI